MLCNFIYSVQLWRARLKGAGIVELIESKLVCDRITYFTITRTCNTRLQSHNPSATCDEVSAVNFLLSHQNWSYL